MLKIPNRPPCEYRRSASVGLHRQKGKIVKSPRKAEHKKSQSSDILDPKISPRKNSMRSRYVQQLMREKIKERKSNIERWPNASNRILNEQKLIAPCGKNFLYYISRTDLQKINAEIVEPKKLIQPCQRLSLSLKSRPITPSPDPHNIACFSRHTSSRSSYFFQTPNSRQRSKENRTTNLSSRYKDELIEPWEFGQEFGEIEDMKRKKV